MSNAVASIETMTADITKPDVRLQLATMLDNTIGGYEHEAETLVVADPDGHALAVGYDDEMRDAEKAINHPKTGLRVRMVKPLNDQVAEINAFFKPRIERLAAAREKIRNKILPYTQKVEAEKRRKAQEAQEAADKAKRLAQEAADKATQETATPEVQEAAQVATAIAQQAQINAATATVAAEQKSIKTDLGSSGITKVWAWELADFALVPDRYKVLNEVLLNKTVKPKDGIHDIPGLRIFEKDQLSTRR